jgi:hypothetical protein
LWLHLRLTSHHAATHRASELTHHLLLWLLRLSTHAAHRASKLAHWRLGLVELTLGLSSELPHWGLHLLLWLHLRLTSHHAATHRASELPH